MADQIDVPVTQDKKALKVPETAPATSGAQQEQVGVQKPMGEGKPSRWWLWFIIGLIVGAGLSIAYFLFLK